MKHVEFNKEHKKLCLIYNSAPLYREAIFRKIDEEYDCDWYFGPKRGDIEEMDVKKLKNVYQTKLYGNPNKVFIKRGVLRLLFNRKYKTFFMLVETRSLTDWLFLWMAHSFFPGKSVYLWTHGWYGKETGIDAKMKLWLYKHVAGTFVYSDYARELLIERGVPEGKLFTIHNSLDFDRQKELRESIKPSKIYKEHFGNNNPIIIFIGRLTKVKQLDMLVNAVSDLNRSGQPCNLVFVGDGIERDKLVSLVEGLGIKDIVWFFGACYDERQNAELIYNADLCVAPGNVGLTAMHTMVFGTPVITHNEFKWQMPEFEAIRPGKTGDFFDYKNKDSLIRIISRWFKEKSDKREEVRQACYKEIDTGWNPYFQMDVIRKNLIL